MSWIGDLVLGDTVDFKFCTVQSTGAPTTLAGSPVISAYPGNSTTQLTAGITLTVDFDSVTGLNNVRVVASGGNGYATATNYAMVITTGTVNSVSVVGYVLEHFSIEARVLNAAKIASDTLTAAKIAADAITAAKIADGAIDAATFAAGAINAAAIAADAITAAKIADGAIDAATFAANAITSTVLANDAITDAKVAADVTIASVTGAVGSVAGAVGSVTGNVGGNVAGSVGSVTAGVTVTTNNDKTGYSLSAAGIIAFWDAATALLTTAGSIGKLLVDNINATISSRATVATILAGVVEGTRTVVQSLRLLNSIGGGTRSGFGTAAPKIRDIDNTKDRMVGSGADGVGNVTMTVDVT